MNRALGPLRDGVWLVTCNEAREVHGSVVPHATGCAQMWITVPRGSSAAPILLSARTGFGGIHASNMVAEAIDLRAPFGLVADLVPVEGATLELVGSDLVSGMCSSWLRVPESTAFDEVALSVADIERGYVGSDPDDRQFWLQTEIEGFSDAPAIPDHTRAYTWQRSAQGPRVEFAHVHADLGKAILTTGAVPSADELTLCASADLFEGWQTPE